MARDARFALACLHGNQPWRFGPAGRGPAHGDRFRALHRRPGDSRSPARGLRPLGGGPRPHHRARHRRGGRGGVRAPPGGHRPRGRGGARRPAAVPRPRQQRGGRSPLEGRPDQDRRGRGRAARPPGEPAGHPGADGAQHRRGRARRADRRDHPVDPDPGAVLHPGGRVRRARDRARQAAGGRARGRRSLRSADRHLSRAGGRGGAGAAAGAPGPLRREPLRDDAGHEPRPWPGPGRRAGRHPPRGDHRPEPADHRRRRRLPGRGRADADDDRADALRSLPDPAGGGPRQDGGDQHLADGRLPRGRPARRNLLPADVFPYATVAGARYDSGDYVAALDRALELAGYQRLREEQAERRARGDRLQLGIGLSTYVEVTGFGAEIGGVEIEPNGSVTAITGTSPHGQGHETSWAQLVAATLGVEIDQVQVVHSDTARVPGGAGTMGSRSLQVGGSAVFHPGHGLGVAGAPATALSWAALAEAAADPARRPEGMDGDGALAAQASFEMPGSTYPFGAHVAVVEVDVETGLVRLLRHVAVDDSGRLLNPLLAEGQVHGGIAQGAAQALFEEVRYDADGNNLTGSLATYAMPSAAELPSFETARMETPSPLNPLGAKGIGESGAIGSTPAVHNAVVDALHPYGVTDIDMPTTPERVWRAIQRARPA